MLRASLAVLGWILAFSGLWFLQPHEGPTYAVLACLLFLLNFFWLNSRIPFALPYLATTIAFVYIVGLPVIAIEYAVRVVAYPLLVVLSRLGYLTMPQPLVELMGTPHENGRAQAWIDYWATLSLGAIGLAIRFAVFTVTRSRFPSIPPIVAIVPAEVAAWTSLALLNLLLPVPTAHLLRRQKRPVELDDERLDVTLSMLLLLPLLVALIFQGYLAHGLVAATIYSLATLGPHFLVKLMNNRREVLARGRIERELNLRLESKQRELNDFVYAVTHDLQSPLSAILLTADLELSRAGGSLNPTHRERLRQIAELATGASAMIRGLLDHFQVVSAPETAKEVDLAPLVRGVVESLDTEARSKRTRIEIGALPRVWGQEGKVVHVFRNLIQNAIKYTPAEVGFISITAERDVAGAIVSVADNGIGIDPIYHERIFDLFVRVPAEEQEVNGRAVEGSGVGLSIVKRLVEAQRGTIWVNSSRGAGSRFCVRLPSHADEGED